MEQRHPVRYLNTSEAAYYLALTESGLRLRCKRGGVPFGRLGRHLRFTMAELDACVCKAPIRSAGELRRETQR